MLWLVAWTTSLPSSPSGPTADPSWRRTWLCNSYAVRSPHGKAGEMGMLCCYRKASSTAGRSHPPKALPEMQDCCKWFLIGAASLISFDSCFMDASKLVTGSVLSFLIHLQWLRTSGWLQVHCIRISGTSKASLNRRRSLPCLELSTWGMLFESEVFVFAIFLLPHQNHTPPLCMPSGFCDPLYSVFFHQDGLPNMPCRTPSNRELHHIPMHLKCIISYHHYPAKYPT